MVNQSEVIASPTPGGMTWLHVIAGSLLSGAVSASVGFWLGSRPSTSCGCKSKTPSGQGNINGVGGEKAA